MQLFLLAKDRNGAYILEGEEAHHCMRVLRHQVGDTIDAIDGKGTKYTARILTSSKKEVELDIIDHIPNWGESGLTIRLGISPLRQRDRFEWAIEKAVELGVHEIAPLICKRTVKTGLKASRIQKIATSAAKQCKRSKIPDLGELKSLQSFEAPAGSLKFIAWCEASEAIQNFSQKIESAEDITILIGPEGDFSEEELHWAKEAGYQPVSLGESRLRTETAAIFALASIKSIKRF